MVMECSASHIVIIRNVRILIFFVFCNNLYKIVLVLFLAKDFLETPSEFRDTVRQFSQIGPPRNVTVVEKSTGDGYVVGWDAPDYGLEVLRVYVVRWYREPGHFFHGSAETRELYYESKAPPPLPPPPLNNIFTNVSHSLPVNSLIEDQVYTFQVFSLSNTDYQAGSNEFELQVPPYRRMRAIAIGATTGLLILLAASAVFIYTKKRCFNPYEAENNEKS